MSGRKLHLGILCPTRNPGSGKEVHAHGMVVSFQSATNLPAISSPDPAPKRVLAGFCGSKNGVAFVPHRGKPDTV